MRIAICDDEPAFCIDLKEKLYEYSNTHNWEPVIDIYTSGVELNHSRTKYDLIILDYQMDALNGLDTAKLLREGKNKSSCIVFLTNYPEIAISAYDVDTFRFVVKNTLYEGLYKALEDYRKVRNIHYDISIKSENEHIAINTSEIILIEVQNKDITLHLTNGRTIKTKGKLSALYNHVPQEVFCRIHNSYVINMAYIHRRNKDEIKLCGLPCWLHVSRSHYRNFKDKYANFLKDQ